MIADTKIKAINKLDVEYYDLSADLKKEIVTLRSQIAAKNETIKQLKDIENSDKRKERNDIKKIIDKYRQVIDSSELDFKSYIKDMPHINQVIIDLNNKHTEAEMQLLTELKKAKKELTEQKEINRSLINQNNDEIIANMEQKLM